MSQHKRPAHLRVHGVHLGARVLVAQLHYEVMNGLLSRWKFSGWGEGAMLAGCV